MEIFKVNIQDLVRVAGMGQIALVIGSLAIPKILKWPQELAKVQPLIKQIFWTYAAYILIINLSFGLVSVFDFYELTNGSRLAMLSTGFISVYWISRISIQFFYFDRTNFPQGKWYKLGEILLVVLFVLFSTVYGWASYINYQH